MTGAADFSGLVTFYSERVLGRADWRIIDISCSRATFGVIAIRFSPSPAGGEGICPLRGRVEGCDGRGFFGVALDLD